MSSFTFRNMSPGQSVQREANNFRSILSPSQVHYGTIFSSADMGHALEENGLDDLAQIDKRTAHNALERQRRENLSTKFQQLAHALPSLQSVRRPSKTVIVAKSLEFVSNSINRESSFQKQIDSLRRKNDRLRDKVQLRGKQKGRTSSTTTTTTATAMDTTPTATSASSTCSSSLADMLYLCPGQLEMKPQKHEKKKSNLTVFTTITSKVTQPSSSLSLPTPPTSTEAAEPTPTSPDLKTSVSTARRSPSSTSMGSTSTTSTSDLTSNSSVKRRKSTGESVTKKRNRLSPSPPPTIAITTDDIGSSINSGLLSGYTSSMSMSHLTPMPHILVLPDQEVFQRDLTSPFVNHHYHHQSINGCYYPTTAVMIPQHTPSPLTAAPHHHHAASAAAAVMGAQHLVAPFPTSTRLSDDTAMMPPFQSAVLDMSSSFTVDETITPPPSSYMPNLAYHSVVYPPPYQQTIPSTMDYPW